MKIQCAKCGREYEVEESFIGQNVECECGEKWEITAPTEPRPEPEKTKKCPMCGEEILAIAKKCRFCGEYLSEDNKPIQRKDRLVYTILGLFLGHLGAHNFYAAQYPAAIAKLLILIWTAAMAASFKPHEPAWLMPASINTYFIIWDLCYDPNMPTKQRKKICGIAPWLFSVLVLVVFWIAIIGIQAALFLSYGTK